MTKCFNRLFPLLASGLLVAPLFAGPTTAPALSADSAPTTAPTKAAAAWKPDMRAIGKFRSKAGPLGLAVAPIGYLRPEWSDPARRALFAPHVQAPLNELLPLIDGMFTDGKGQEMQLLGGEDYLLMAAVFGDDDLQKQVTDMAAKPGVEGNWAKVAQTTAKYYLANGDTAAQGKAIDAMEALADSDPTTASTLGDAAASIYRQDPDKQIADRLNDFVTSKLELPIIAEMQISPVLENNGDWSDPAKRAKLASNAQPLLKVLLPMIDATFEKSKNSEARFDEGEEFMLMGVIFGDDDVHKQVAAMTAKPGVEGAWGQVAHTAASYYLANGDLAAENKAIDELEAIPASDKATAAAIARVCTAIYETDPDKQLATRLDNFVTKKLKASGIAQMKQQQEMDAKRQAFVGKPLVIESILRDGTKFSTADLKGKVILLDFWATWCGPCRAELPRVKKEYADMHDKGLEVVSVSFDQKLDNLNLFLSFNPDMPWPQLYDPKYPFWSNQIGKKYLINGIPTMFLIDKNGICRSVTAREDFEKVIPQLLAEKSAI